MEPIGTGAAANISSEAAKCIFLEAKQYITYVIKYKKNAKKFEEKLEKLMEKRSSVEQDVVVAERNVEKIKADVVGWRNRVDIVITEEEKQVKVLEVKASNNCFFGLCPNIGSRYQLSRKAEEGAATFDELIQECHFGHVGYRDVPQLIARSDFESFESRVKVFNDIMESLKYSTLSNVGVYGMAGVGKSWLVKEVERQVQNVQLFDSVVWVIVSPAPDIQKIQEQIAESLGLKLEENSLDVRAHRLYDRLKQEKKILVILDDIWKKLDLEKVGIPFGNQHKGCKILLASRNQNVLTNEMDATKTFAIGDLREEEALEFFKKMVAVDDVETNEELRSTVIDVAKKCARFPLAIATVARALKNKPQPVWRDALRQLQRPYSENPSEITAEVYSAIKLSFNLLPSEDLKQTFLLCSLLRRDTPIRYLLTYAIGLGLINGVATLEEAKEPCLLIDSNINEEHFDVHDHTYLVAKSIASKDNLVFALKDEDAKIDWPDGDSLKMYNQICLQFLNNNNLPE